MGKQFFDAFYPSLRMFFPDVGRNLKLLNGKVNGVEMDEKRAVFFLSKKAFIYTVVLTIITGVWFVLYDIPIYYILLMLPVYFIAMMFYMRMYLRTLVSHRRKDIDYEIVYMLRHIIVGARSGMPLYDILTTVADKYGEAGAEISRIIELTAAGKPLHQSLTDAAQTTPSKYMERVFIQLSNSLSSGADVATTLSSLLKQITDEEMIQIKSYGRRLTPFTMFYMIFGIIIPSIGIVLVTIMFSVMGSSYIRFDNTVLFLVVLGLAFLQYLFLGMIKSGRPKYIV